MPFGCGFVVHLLILLTTFSGGSIQSFNNIFLNVVLSPYKLMDFYFKD